MGNIVVTFLLGMVTGALIVFFLTHKDSARIKAEKEAVEKEYQEKLTSIEKDRASKIAELEKQKALLDEERAKLASMTPQEAKEKLSPETQDKVEEAKQTATSEAVKNIMDRVKQASQGTNG